MRAMLVLAASAASLLPVAASASTTNTLVTNVYVNQDGIVAFDIADPKPQHPSCSASNNFVFRSTSVPGQSMLAVLLTAKSTNKPVTIFGSDACNTDGNTEDMTAVIIKT